MVPRVGSGILPASSPQQRAPKSGAMRAERNIVLPLPNGAANGSAAARAEPPSESRISQEWPVRVSGGEFAAEHSSAAEKVGA